MAKTTTTRPEKFLIALVRPLGRSQWRNRVRLSSGTARGRRIYVRAVRSTPASPPHCLPLCLSDRITSLLTPSHQSCVNSEIGSFPVSLRFDIATERFGNHGDQCYIPCKQACLFLSVQPGVTLNQP